MPWMPFDSMDKNLESLVSFQKCCRWAFSCTGTHVVHRLKCVFEVLLIQETLWLTQSPRSAVPPCRPLISSCFLSVASFPPTIRNRCQFSCFRQHCRCQHNLTPHCDVMSCTYRTEIAKMRPNSLSGGIALQPPSSITDNLQTMSQCISFMRPQLQGKFNYFILTVFVVDVFTTVCVFLQVHSLFYSLHSFAHFACLLSVYFPLSWPLIINLIS